MTTTENLTSNNPNTKSYWDRIATANKDQAGRINPNGCAYCDVDQCQHTDN